VKIFSFEKYRAKYTEYRYRRYVLKNVPLSVTLLLFFAKYQYRYMGVGSGGQGGRGHGTNIVDRGLKVLYFGLFLLFFGLFSVAPLEEAK